MKAARFCMSFIKCFHVPSFNHVRAHNRSVFKRLSVSIKNHFPVEKMNGAFTSGTWLVRSVSALRCMLMNSAQNRYCFLLPIMSAMPRPSSLTDEWIGRSISFFNNRIWLGRTLSLLANCSTALLKGAVCNQKAHTNNKSQI